MRVSRLVRAWLAMPVLALAGTGCLATRGNIRLLQQDIRVLQGQLAQEQQQTQQLIAALRAEADAGRVAAVRADSARRTQIENLLVAVRLVSDSLSAASDRLLRLRAENASDHAEFQTQLVAVYTQMGASQRAIAAMRDQVETTAQGTGAAPATGTPAGATPSVATLLIAAREQLGKGANTTARGAFQDVLQQPNARSDQLSEAAAGIAQTYENEGDAAQADSIRATIPDKYPGTTFASNALYKHGDYLLKNMKTAEAKAAFERIIADYPASEEAGPARLKLRAIAP